VSGCVRKINKKRLPTLGLLPHEVDGPVGQFTIDQGTVVEVVWARNLRSASLLALEYERLINATFCEAFKGKGN